MAGMPAALQPLWKLSWKERPRDGVAFLLLCLDECAFLKAAPSAAPFLTCANHGRRCAPRLSPEDVEGLDLEDLADTDIA
jgi:hypothetical protein